MYLCVVLFLHVEAHDELAKKNVVNNATGTLTKQAPVLGTTYILRIWNKLLAGVQQHPCYGGRWNNHQSAGVGVGSFIAWPREKQF